MKKFLSILTVILTFLFNNPLFSQTFNLKWVNAFHKARCNDVAIDADGNAYLIGTFSDTTDFDPGSDVELLTYDTIYKSYLAKYDANGKYVFAYLLPGYADNIDIDQIGNLWISGSFEHTADFDPGIGTHTLTAYQHPNRSYNRDLYLAKYDRNGSYQLAFSLVDTTLSSEIDDLTVDYEGNVYITGNFRETVDFDPSSGSAKLTANAYNGDVFIAKYNPSGGIVYAHHLAIVNSKLINEGHKVRVDNENNLYLCGRFLGSMDLDPSVDNFVINSGGGIDGFVAKYDKTGNFLFGGGFEGVCRAMDVAPNGDFYIGGTMPDSMDADFGAGTSMLYSSNNFDVWLAHYDKLGKLISAKAFEGNNLYHTYDFHVNPDQEILMIGYIRDTVDFNPGNTGGKYSSNGDHDAFVVKLDASCDFQRGTSFGGKSMDLVNIITGDANGDLWICGSFGDSTDFDPSEKVNWHSNGTSSGGFLARYEDPDVMASMFEIKKDLLDVGVYAFNDAIYIDFSNVEMVDAEVDVYNLMGQLIHRKSHQNREKLVIPIRNSKPQIYNVRVKNMNNVITKKVMLK